MGAAVGRGGVVGRPRPPGFDMIMQAPLEAWFSVVLVSRGGLRLAGSADWPLFALAKLGQSVYLRAVHP